MNMKRILLAGMVLVLTGACAWAAPEISDTAGFTALPDREAPQIVGGAGWVCDYNEGALEGGLSAAFL